MADTGHGTTITFSGGFTAQIRMVQQPEFEIPVVDISHLAQTTGAAELKMAGDLMKCSPVEFEWLFSPNTRPTLGGTAQTITITFPIPAGGSTGATLVGTGFINKWTPGEQKSNTEMLAKGSIQFDGATGPTWTNGS